MIVVMVVLVVILFLGRTVLYVCPSYDITRFHRVMRRNSPQKKGNFHYPYRVIKNITR